MSLFNLPVERKKTVAVHPWTRSIKYEYSHKIKRAHNSVKNVQIYPKPYMKERIPHQNRITFIVIGNRVTKDFIYCVNLVKGLHKYKWKNYDTPIIRGVNTLEWHYVLRDIQMEYGPEAYCLESQVVVIMNGKILGGKFELKRLVEKEYIYYLALNYHKESVNQFATYIRGSSLYSDVVPITCENFLRLCQKKMGGYSGTPVHRIVKDGWIQCGGYTLRSSNLKCENFIIPHDRRGVLSMANDGRYKDCSTQFFVLLQPNDWLKFKYVAFGQLIEGEETLRKIEAVTTHYESPTASIIIYTAGILNMDCHDIAINKTALAYLEKHTENLVALEELLYQLLLENVFLEIEYRMLQLMEPPKEEEVLVLLTNEEKETKEILDAKRAKRQKEEIMIQIKKYRVGSPDGRSRGSKGSRTTTVMKYYVNPEYGEGDEMEEYPFSQVSTVPPPKIKKPYYLEFTDIPYPGEVDSNYDLKRFLVGDYCLECDLNPEQPKKVRADIKELRENKLKSLAKMMSSYGISKEGAVDMESSSSSSSWSEIDIADSDEEKELEEYLREYGEKVSFSGKKVNKIARKHFKDNPLEDLESHGFFTDEDMRRITLARRELEQRETKKISISVHPWQIPKEIKRRQTGFIRYAPEPEEEEKKEIKKVESPSEATKRSKDLSVEDIQRSIKKKKAGFASSSQGMVKIRSLQRQPAEKDEDKDELRPKVRITHMDPTAKTCPKKGQTAITQTSKREMRPSVLARLYSDIGLYSEEAMPTLKDFKPVSEIGMKKDKEELLLEDTETLNNYLRRNENVFRRDENVLRRSLSVADDASYKELFPGKVQKPDKQTDDIKEIKGYSPLRKTLNKTQRPWLTVSQYQIKNAQKPNTSNESEKSKEN